MHVGFFSGKKVASLRNTKRSSHLTASYPRFNYSGNAEKNRGSNETASYKRQPSRSGAFLGVRNYSSLFLAKHHALSHISSSVWVASQPSSVFAFDASAQKAGRSPALRGPIS